MCCYLSWNVITLKEIIKKLNGGPYYNFNFIQFTDKQMISAI